MTGPTCAHCGWPAIGYASVPTNDLCHPRGGMDCFVLVTDKRHPTPCLMCHEFMRTRRTAPTVGAQRQASDVD